MIKVSLRNRAGLVIAEAIVDDEDTWVLGQRWSLTRAGYARSGGRLMHRLILGVGPTERIDHINRDRLDNRRANLRLATQAENLQNKPSYKGSSSRYRGVSWVPEREKWRARSRLNGLPVHHGYFDNEDEAGEAAREWRLNNMPYATD